MMELVPRVVRRVLLAINVFDPIRRKMLTLRSIGVGNSWRWLGNVHVRNYRNYDAYVAHQKSKYDLIISDYQVKPDNIDIYEYDREFSLALRERLQRVDLLRRGDSVLCLGARSGAEVKAFIGMGCFTVGVDLNPGPSNLELINETDFHYPWPGRAFVFKKTKNN